MDAIQAWHVWIVLGIIFVIIEIIVPMYFFLSLGIGAIFTGLLSLIPFVRSFLAVQILVFAIVSFIAFLAMKKLGKKVLQNTDAETNVYALKGKTGFITRAIPAKGKGYVKIGGEEWPAVEINGKELAEGTEVTVINIEGNKAVVEGKS